jgi:hypothetical protein
MYANLNNAALDELVKNLALVCCEYCRFYTELAHQS